MSPTLLKSHRGTLTVWGQGEPFWVGVLWNWSFSKRVCGKCAVVMSEFDLCLCCWAEEQNGAFRCGGGGAGDVQRAERGSLEEAVVAPSGSPAGVASWALGGGGAAGISCRPCESLQAVFYSQIKKSCLSCYHFLSFINKSEAVYFYYMYSFDAVVLIACIAAAHVK